MSDCEWYRKVSNLRYLLGVNVFIEIKCRVAELSYGQLVKKDSRNQSVAICENFGFTRFFVSGTFIVNCCIDKSLRLDASPDIEAGN